MSSETNAIDDYRYLRRESLVKRIHDWIERNDPKFTCWNEELQLDLKTANIGVQIEDNLISKFVIDMPGRDSEGFTGVIVRFKFEREKGGSPFLDVMRYLCTNDDVPDPGFSFKQCVSFRPLNKWHIRDDSLEQVSQMLSEYVDTKRKCCIYIICMNPQIDVRGASLGYHSYDDNDDPIQKLFHWYIQDAIEERKFNFYSTKYILSSIFSRIVQYFYPNGNYKRVLPQLV